MPDDLSGRRWGEALLDHRAGFGGDAAHDPDPAMGADVCN
jgi:hypothetical protein